MSNQILVPVLGESITEATVAKWLKDIGDQVSSDEPLVELETDKVNIEVPSPTNGTLSQIKVQAGETVKVGALLGTLDGKSLKPSTIKKEKEVVSKAENTNEEKIFSEKEEKIVILNEPIKKNIESSDEIIDQNKTNEEENVLILESPINENQDNLQVEKILSPSVKKIVDENKIDISTLKGTGKRGMILKGDLIDLMGNVPEMSKRNIKYGPEERVKMTRLRITIAKRLKEAQNNAAILSTFNEIDMQNIMQIRKDYQEDFQKKYSVKLGLMSFFIKSCVVALKNFPALNAEIADDEIIYKNYYNIGVAVGTDRGLVVPVLKNADRLSFSDIEKNIFSLSEKARKGKIVIDDLQGGTFTISNGGIYGSMLSTPILNPPQTGVLGMHNIVERPIVKEGSVVIRPIMYLALSYDHRIIDGKEAVSFLKTVKECLEEPRRLFLNL